MAGAPNPSWTSGAGPRSMAMVTAAKGGDCACGYFDWSYVWIANSGQGTLSKINTRTMEEEGRYETGGYSPSRTSVSADGKMATVANRGTGLSTFWALPQFCEDKNGNGEIDTSTGKDDVLPFGEDECMRWSILFPGMTNQRPVAWTAKYNPSSCLYEDQKIWTVTSAGGDPGGAIDLGHCSQETVFVHLVDGDTGIVEETIEVDHDFGCLQGFHIGPYGGAVDHEGNFWFMGFSDSMLGRVDRETLEVELFPEGGGYGITVDTQGRVWTTGAVRRFDPMTGENTFAGVGGSGGLAQGLDGLMWSAHEDGNVAWVDMETMESGVVPLPGDNTTKGVSVDIDGFIWATRKDDSIAYRIHPTTFELATYNGLNNPTPTPT